MLPTEASARQSKSGKSFKPIFAKDHARFDKCCGAKDSILSMDCAEIAERSGLSCQPSVAIAHAILDKFCGPPSAIRAAAALEICYNNGASN
mmetsp:Transcript_42175/g.98466  ORF Transcript_42175/g.98466 Transcript_42175/m.98466 type:complete len:92 (-) Transcript_42175:415-690(-)